MAILSKDLGSITIGSRTVKVAVFYDSATGVSSGEIPTAKDSFISIGEFVERIEKKSGILELSNVAVEIREDYSTYVAGVWYKLLQGSELQLRFYLDEGAGDTFLFWGMLSRDTEFRFREKFISSPGSSGRYVRTVSVPLVSMLYKLRDASIFGDLFTAIAGNDYNDSLGGTSLRFDELIGCFAVTAWGYTDASVASSAVFPSSSEIQFQDSLGNWRNVNELSVRIQLSNSPITPSPYFDAYDVTGQYWGTRFKDPLEVLSHLAKSYGFLIRYFYGQADGTIGVSGNLHRIQFVTRGRTANVVTPGEVIESDLSVATILKPSDVYFSRLDNTEAYGTTGGDIEERLDFLYSPGSIQNQEKFYYNRLGTYGLPIAVRFYNYSTGAYSTGASYTTEAMRYYYFYRIASNTQAYKRTHWGIGATYSGATSHRFLVPGCRIAIHDGVSSKNFYANEVRKNIMKNTASVQWIGE